MFKFLKEKLGNALKKIGKKAEEEAKEEIAELPVEEKPKKKDVKKKKAVVKEEVVKEHKEEARKEVVERKEEAKPEKKGFFSKIFRKKEAKTEEEAKEAVEETKKVPEAQKVELVEEIKAEEKAEEKKGLFAKLKEKVVTKRISADKFEELFQDLEIVLLENNVALEVVDKIKDDLKKGLVDRPIRRGRVLDEIRKTLKESIEWLFDVEPIDVLKMIKEKKEKPFVIVFLGQNGSGKTTSIAKVTYLLKNHGKSVVLAAADTFRAASLEQIKEWGNRLGVHVIAHDYGADPAAVGFDSVKYSKAHNIDVVLIDTAGRQHSNENLMREMEKIVRVVKPDLKIFVGESLVGNDAVDQAESFNEAVGVDGVILTKADVDEKGGAMISVEYVIRKPIIYLGCGQELGDLKEFDPRLILLQLGL